MLTAHEAAALQQIIDNGDPFIVEFYHSLTIDQMMTQMQNMNEELERIQSMNNEGWVHRQKQHIMVLSAMYQLKSDAQKDNREGHAVV